MRSFQETPWDPGGLQLQLEDKTLEMLSSPLEMLSRQNLGLLVVMVLNTLLSHKLSGRNSLLPEPLSHQVRFDVEDFQLPVTSYQANFCIILEWFSAMAITWNSLHDGMDASAKSWEQELYLTLVTESYGRGANAIWESSDFACIHLSQLLVVVRHHHGYARHKTYWLESYLSSIDRAAILQLFGVVQGYLKKWNFAFSAGLHAWVALVVCTCTKYLKEGIYNLIFAAIRCSKLLDLLINNLSVEDCKDLAMSNSSKASRTEDTCDLDEIETQGENAYNTGSFGGITHAEDRDSSQAKLWDPGGVQQRLVMDWAAQ
jgi:hypothetical protein